MERTPEHSHAGATGFAAPPGVTIHQIPKEKNIGTMMASGELHATLLYIRDANLIDRSTIDLHNHPDVQPLFPDADAEGARYYRKTGLYPINHGMVVKRAVAEKHPWVVLNLLKAFDRANEIADRERLEHADYHIETGLLPAAARAALRTPVVRHGIVANRKVLETAAQYSHEQGLTPRPIRLDEVFAKSTLEQ
jgi:4,5-dihydroxyphthalate decarboxylase